MSNERAIEKAEAIAASLRRLGYPDATPAPEYCIEEWGMDNFYTFTASVYVGEYKPKEKTSWRGMLKRLVQRAP